MLLGATHKTRFGNALIDLDDSPVNKLPTDSHSAVDIVNDFYDLNCDWTQLYISSDSPLNEYKSNILTYVSGFCCRKLMKKENCVHCREYLFNYRIRNTSEFLNRKNEGGLILPNVHVDKVVKMTDRLLDSVKRTKNVFTEKNLIEKMYLNVQKLLDIENVNFMKFLDDHVDVMCHNVSHRKKMIKKIVTVFLSLKLKHMAKEKSSSFKHKRIRKTYSKLILFKNQ